MQNISENQRLILEVIAEQVKEMKTENDIQYALKGLLAELSHLTTTKEYFDPSYIAQKARIIFSGTKSD